MIKKVFVGIFATLALAGLVAVTRYHPTRIAPNRPIQLDSEFPSTMSAPGNQHYKNGYFTGQTVDVGYGLVQVRAVISGSKITNIKFLQMPSDRDRTSQITAMAKPILLKETLVAQTADVDIVSGATQTSQGFIQSLEDALSQART